MQRLKLRNTSIFNCRQDVENHRDSKKKKKKVTRPMSEFSKIAE